jgi:acetoin utilization deacetylase AcuC-like enzyme
VERLAAILVDAGIDTSQSERLASMAVTTIEGGFVMARMLKDTAAFLAAGEVVQQLIADALPA